MTREVVLDTETTGLDPYQGDRLVEIGCLELFNHLPTGRVFHTYLNPDREVPKEAFEVHGLSYDFLKEHPFFGDIASSFLEFIEDSPLIIHNAKFDLKFLNAELKILSVEDIPFHRAIDTLFIARQKFPGSPASLDALCKRFGVDNKARNKHGALLDAELLAQVYLELIGGKQPSLSLETDLSEGSSPQQEMGKKKKYYPPRPHAPSSEEYRLHQELLAKLS